jgi:hypothetical protein
VEALSQIKQAFERDIDSFLSMHLVTLNSGYSGDEDSFLQNQPTSCTVLIVDYSHRLLGPNGRPRLYYTSDSMQRCISDGIALGGRVGQLHPHAYSSPINIYNFITPWRQQEN